MLSPRPLGPRLPPFLSPRPLKPQCLHCLNLGCFLDARHSQDVRCRGTLTCIPMLLISSIYLETVAIDFHVTSVVVLHSSTLWPTIPFRLFGITPAGTTTHVSFRA
ncbi:hypothetical protein KC19_VG206100 [Ceratodon purpureus]|uniref:Uncharacterized protein n=1 Tax=Ceratodon purpureus TaxID=3225 RepID=A0A8T0HSG6_CERPU|nr:hypothetical protein KC19_VG206100 [Ceratodon purpureus]